MTNQVVDVDRQQPQRFADLSAEELIRLRSVASRRGIQAYDEWIVERDKVREINGILKGRGFPVLAVPGEGK